MKKYIITFSILIGLLIIGIGGTIIYQNMNNNTPSVEIVRAKANEELKYLDMKITSLANQFNHISYANYRLVENEVKTPNSQNNDQEQQSSSGGQSQGTSEDTKMRTANMESNSILTNDNEKVDWDAINEEVELLYSTWPSVLVDLNSLNVNRDNLLNFTTTLDDLINALEEENEKESLIKLSDLYRLTSGYLKEYSNDNMMNNIFTTKAHIIRIYALAEQDNWNEMKQNITAAKTEYSNILNNSLNSNNINSINRGYILLNEIEKNINQKDKDIFYINYKNLMQELEVML